MNEDYVSYELALKLKKCGFDEPCDSYYDKACVADDEYWHTMREAAYNWNVLDSDCQISAPTLAHSQKWLREKKGIAINVIAHDGGVYDYDIVFLPNAVDCDYPIDRATFSRTYEEALSEGIESVLELIKEGE